MANPNYSRRKTAAKDNQVTQDIMRERQGKALRALTRSAEFIPLPDTETEARAIATIFNASDKSQALQLGEDASRSNLMRLNQAKKLDDFRFLVFATHGILPGEVDLVTQSALVLSHPDEEGFLTTGDVFGLKLNARLVSLSACNTGMGKRVAGEGVMGLTRAFMFAGTPAVAVTLWSVESVSAMKLNVGFFQAMKDVGKAAQALRRIKLQMLRGNEGETYRAPFYWAPLVVFGDALAG